MGGVAGATSNQTNNVNASSGSSSNNNNTTVCINATNGTTTTTDNTNCPSGYNKCGSSTTCPSTSPSPSCGSAKTCPSVSNSTEKKTSVAASSLPETGSNTLTNSAAIATGVLVGVLGISYIGSVLYRRLALK